MFSVRTKITLKIMLTSFHNVSIYLNKCLKLYCIGLQNPQKLLRYSRPIRNEIVRASAEVGEMLKWYGHVLRRTKCMSVKQ